MNVLYTTPFVPYPPEDGGRMVAFHHLKGLASRGHRLTMILPLRRPEDHEGIAHLHELGTVRAIPIRPRSMAGIAGKAMLHGESFRIRRHRLPEIERVLERTLDETFDLVFLDSLFTAYLAPLVRKSRPDVPLVLFEHNVESQVFRRLVATSPSRAWKFLARWETPRIENAERRATSRVTRVLTLSREDSDSVRALSPAATTSVCGPGISTYPDETIAPPPSAHTVLFLASYRWPPNIDGAVWLATSIWPRVREKIPRAHLVLAGPDPSGRIRRLANPNLGIEAPGFVESAVETTRMANVTVAPLLSGGGIRLKILEALANERPLVSTGLGAEGLDLEAGIHYLRADDERAFADQIVRLLNDREEAARIAAAGRRRVEERYSWTAAATRLEAALEETVAQARAPGIATG